MNKPLIIIGNGGHASVLTELLLAQGEKIIGFTAPIKENNGFGIPYLGKDEHILQYKLNEVELVLGIGMVEPNGLREKVFRYFSHKGYHFKTILHPSIIMASSVILGEGVQIMAGVIIQTNAKIADNTIINTGAQIDHDCLIAKNVHIAPGATLSGAVHIGESTHVGTGATIIQNIVVGSNCLIGAGAVVVKNLTDNVKAYGVPAKEVK